MNRIVTGDKVTYYAQTIGEIEVIYSLFTTANIAILRTDSNERCITVKANQDAKLAVAPPEVRKALCQMHSNLRLPDISAIMGRQTPQSCAVATVAVEWPVYAVEEI